MNRLLLRAAWFFCLIFSPQTYAEKPFFPYPTRTSTLPNGLTVVRVPLSSAGLVAFYTVVRVGSRNEVEDGKTGFAHFFEHMMFKGTPANPEGQRESQLGKLGFHENAFTTDDVTVYHVVGPSAHLQTLINLEADRFMNLKYSEQTFQTEARAVLGEYHKNAANPGLKIEEALLQTAFSQHTYRHTTLGFYEDIQAMPKAFEYSKSFFKNWYTPDNTQLVIAGDFDDLALMAMIQKAYGGWVGSVAKVQIPVEAPQTAQRSVSVEWPSPTLPRHLHAWKTPSGIRSAAIQNVLGAYMSGPTSPLHRDLVLERQLAQDIHCGYQDHRDPGLFILSATLKEETHRDAVRAAFDLTVKELVSGKIDRARLGDIKNNLRYGLLMSLETATDVALQVGYLAGVFGPPDALEQLYQEIARVSPEDLQAFAKEYFTADHRTLLSFSTKTSTEGK